MRQMAINFISANSHNAVIKGALKDLRYLDDLNRVLFNNLVKFGALNWNYKL